MRSILLFFAVIFLFSCAEPAAKLPEMDLMSKGLPIKIKAPEDVVVEVSDYGLMKDVTVKNDKNFYLQIFSSDAMSTDLKAIKDEKLNEVKSKESFTKIIEEDESGFIYEKMRSDSTLNYDFRHIRFQGDKQYIFQTGLVGKFSEDEVRMMYQAVK